MKGFGELAVRWRPLRGLWTMVGLAVVVGLCSGMLAVGLREGVHLLFESLRPVRGTLAGIFLPAVGALIGVMLVRVAFREPGAHGVPEILESVSLRGGAMHRRSIFSRLIGSLVNVASGGSAGLEGPIAFSAAAVGSNVGRYCGLAERQTVLLLACGVAGGIGGIFNAPLTGLIFATEVVLAEWSLAAVVPIAVCSTVATVVGRSILGSEGAFQSQQLDFGVDDLVACAPLGILAGFTSLVLVGGIGRLEEAAHVLRAKPGLGRIGVVAALAGLGVGLIGWQLPESIGEGYPTVSLALGGQLEDAFGILFLLLAAKVLATCLTLGSGAPGGIFAPSLVIGAILGSLFGRFLGVAVPGTDFTEPAFYALVAMAGLVAGTMHAPFTGIFLALETTGGWSLTLPLMLVSVLSVLVVRSVRRHSFYTAELANVGRLLRPGTDKRILSDLRVGENLDEDAPTVSSGSTLEDLCRMLPTTARNHFAVVDPGTNRYLGLLNFGAVRGVMFDPQLRRLTPVDTVMDTTLPTIEVDESILDAWKHLDEAHVWVLPVVRDGTFVGMVSKSTLFEHYRNELIVQTAERD